MFGVMLECSDFRFDKGEDCFFTHCGKNGCERIPVMRHSTTRRGRLTNPFHMYAPREGNPLFVPYVIEDSGNEEAIIAEEDVATKNVTENIDVVEESDDDDDDLPIPDADEAESTYRAPMEADR